MTANGCSATMVRDLDFRSVNLRCAGAAFHLDFCARCHFQAPLTGLDKGAATDRHDLTGELHSQCWRSSVALKTLGSGTSKIRRRRSCRVGPTFGAVILLTRLCVTVVLVLLSVWNNGMTYCLLL